MFSAACPGALPPLVEVLSKTGTLETNFITSCFMYQQENFLPCGV